MNTPGWMSLARPDFFAALMNARLDSTTPAFTRVAATSLAPSPGSMVIWVKPVPLPV